MSVKRSIWNFLIPPIVLATFSINFLNYAGFVTSRNFYNKNVCSADSIWLIIKSQIQYGRF